MTDALERARADLRAGRAWQARDRLTSFLVHRQDDEVLELLADVHLAMGDHPKAGALLYVVRRGEVVEEAERAAVAAWRQRFGDDEARWRSIPSPVRSARSADLDQLRGQGRGDTGGPDLPPAQRLTAREWWGLMGCLVVVLGLVALVALVVIGAVTVVGWVR